MPPPGLSLCVCVTAVVVVLGAAAAVDAAAAAVDACPGSLPPVAGTWVPRHSAQFAQAASNWDASPLLPPTPPCAILFASSARDIQAAIAYATASALPLAVRSGRHSYAALSLAPHGIVIDVSALNSTRARSNPPTPTPAPADRTWMTRTASGAACAARADAVLESGPGAALYSVYAAAASVGAVFPGGTCPGVRVGGFTLGGGYGLAARALGLAVDALCEADVVLANGTAVSVGPGHELFWGLAGGGNGNFGVVTRLVFGIPLLPPRLAGNVTVFQATWSGLSQPGDVANAVNGWLRWLADAAPELTPEMDVYHGGSLGSTGMMLGDLDEIRAAVAPLATVGAVPPSLSFTSMRYLDAVRHFGGCADAKACAAAAAAVPSVAAPEYWIGKSGYLAGPLSDAAGAVLEAAMGAATYNCCSGFSGIIIDGYGGAINERPANATAFPHRAMAAHLQFMAYFAKAGSAAAAHAWINDLYLGMRKHITPYAYRNYADRDLLDTSRVPPYTVTWAESYYAGNLGRLNRLKAAVDPEQVWSGPMRLPSPTPT